MSNFVEIWFVVGPGFSGEIHTSEVGKSSLEAILSSDPMIKSNSFTYGQFSPNEFTEVFYILYDKSKNDIFHVLKSIPEDFSKKFISVLRDGKLNDILHD